MAYSVDSPGQAWLTGPGTPANTTLRCKKQIKEQSKQNGNSNSKCSQRRTDRQTQALLLQEVFTSGSQGVFQVPPPRGAYTESTAHGVSHTPFQRLSFLSLNCLCGQHSKRIFYLGEQPAALAEYPPTKHTGC